jgi:hypothetical protein
MAGPGCGCGKPERRLFHGLIRGMDGSLYYVQCQPPCKPCTANARRVSGKLFIGSFLPTVSDAADRRAWYRRKPRSQARFPTPRTAIGQEPRRRRPSSAADPWHHPGP